MRIVYKTHAAYYQNYLQDLTEYLGVEPLSQGLGVNLKVKHPAKHEQWAGISLHWRVSLAFQRKVMQHMSHPHAQDTQALSASNVSVSIATLQHAVRGWCA